MSPIPTPRSPSVHARRAPHWPALPTAPGPRLPALRATAPHPGWSRRSRWPLSPRFDLLSCMRFDEAPSPNARPNATPEFAWPVEDLWPLFEDACVALA